MNLKQGQLVALENSVDTLDYDESPGVESTIEDLVGRLTPEQAFAAPATPLPDAASILARLQLEHSDYDFELLAGPEAGQEIEMTLNSKGEWINKFTDGSVSTIDAASLDDFERQAAFIEKRDALLSGGNFKKIDTAASLQQPLDIKGNLQSAEGMRYDIEATYFVRDALSGKISVLAFGGKLKQPEVQYGFDDDGLDDLTGTEQIHAPFGQVEEPDMPPQSAQTVFQQAAAKTESAKTADQDQDLAEEQKPMDFKPTVNSAGFSIGFGGIAMAQTKPTAPLAEVAAEIYQEQEDDGDMEETALVAAGNEPKTAMPIIIANLFPSGPEQNSATPTFEVEVTALLDSVAAPADAPAEQPAPVIRAVPAPKPAARPNPHIIVEPISIGVKAEQTTEPGYEHPESRASGEPQGVVDTKVAYTLEDTVEAVADVDATKNLQIEWNSDTDTIVTATAPAVAIKQTAKQETIILIRDSAEIEPPAFQANAVDSSVLRQMIVREAIRLPELVRPNRSVEDTPVKNIIAKAVTIKNAAAKMPTMQKLSEPIEPGAKPSTVTDKPRTVKVTDKVRQSMPPGMRLVKFEPAAAARTINIEPVKLAKLAKPEQPSQRTMEPKREPKYAAVAVTPRASIILAGRAARKTQVRSVAARASVQAPRQQRGIERGSSFRNISQVAASTNRSIFEEELNLSGVSLVRAA